MHAMGGSLGIPSLQSDREVDDEALEGVGGVWGRRRVRKLDVGMIDD